MSEYRDTAVTALRALEDTASLFAEAIGGGRKAKKAVSDIAVLLLSKPQVVRNAIEKADASAADEKRQTEQVRASLEQLICLLRDPWELGDVTAEEVEDMREGIAARIEIAMGVR